ncbi:MAG: ligand-binding protein SH3 [Candidatus Latescibacteria bacterium]|nr:ligand-binding protein SH3 [bacterium]MBD3423664.1 ligand-binding protein SH3 [Candidatus Latescibacterota bacterium]
MGSGLPREITTFIISTLPVSELRGAIPYALSQGMNWQRAYIISVLGNFLPVIPILLLLGRVSDFLIKRSRLFERFFNWLFTRTMNRSAVVEKFEALGLILFVAIPLPITGAWTGCVAAFLFKIPLKHAVPAILAGIMISGTVVTLASMGVISFWGL